MDPEDVAAALALREMLIRLRNATAGQVAQLWQLLFDVEEIVESAGRFGLVAARAVVEGQVLAVHAADAWGARFFGRKRLVRRPVVLDPAPFLGLGGDTGVELPDALASSGAYVWRALERGEGEQAASSAGLYRALRITTTEISRAGTNAVGVLAEAEGSPGWRRKTGPNPCPICRGLADGTLQPWSERVQAHPHCSCVPVVVREVGREEAEVEEIEAGAMEEVGA